MLDNTPKQPRKFRTKIWFEINDDSRGTYNLNSQIKFKTSMLRSNLYNYSDAYIPVRGTIIVLNTGEAANPNKRENIIIKNCAPFTDCISEINNTQIDNAENTNIVMPMHNFVEHSDNYSKASGSLWHYYRDEPFLDGNGAIADFLADNNSSALFKFFKKNSRQNRK